MYTSTYNLNYDIMQIEPTKAQNIHFTAFFHKKYK